jgi:phosphatidylglycerophosphate synthase
VLAVRMSPLFGLIAQIILLATLGLEAPGWGLGVAYGLAVFALLRGHVLGPADWVTLARAVLIGGVTALTVDSFSRQIPIGVLVALTVAALSLDAIDGLVARLTGTASEFGARFDMEADAFLLLVLSVYVARTMGVWVLLIGAMRYLFVISIWVLPWMRAQLPPRYWRKVVAAAQGIVLVCAASGVFPGKLMSAALLAALILLLESFGRDVIWLWRRARPHQTIQSGP